MASSPDGEKQSTGKFETKPGDLEWYSSDGKRLGDRGQPVGDGRTRLKRAVLKAKRKK